MKKWQIFVLLKIAEVLVIVFVPYGLGRIGLWLGLSSEWCGNDLWSVYGAGWLMILIPLFVVGCIILIIGTNLGLTQYIHKKLKGAKND